jgi:hypothetical protein
MMSSSSTRILLLTLNSGEVDFYAGGVNNFVRTLCENKLPTCT